MLHQFKTYELALKNFKWDFNFTNIAYELSEKWIKDKNKIAIIDENLSKNYTFYELDILANKLANFSHYDLTEAKVHSSLAYGDIFSYNFALYPKSTQPSGFLDFSQLNSEKTQLHIELSELSKDTEIRYVEDRHKYLFGIPSGGSSYLAEPFSLEDFTMYLYYTGYNMLNFENGFISFVS